MIFDGMKFRRRYDLRWRYAEDGDTYVNGKPVDKYHVVITRANAKPGTMVPITGHGLTNKAYGVEKGTAETRRLPIYLVLDGWVYSTTFKRKPK